MSFEDIFDESYETVLNRKVGGKSFFQVFYEHFVDSSEEVRKKFENTDMSRQKKMLKKSFYSLIVFYATGNADDYLYKIAANHSPQYLNIRPELYDLWLDTLIKTVREFDPLFCNDTELAWRLVLTPGITYMKFKHASPREYAQK